jgi:glutamine amidotransferase
MTTTATELATGRKASSRALRATLIDAGVGNLGNLRRAFEAVGAEVEVTADPAAIRSSSCLVLPGVGAFRPPREALRGALEGAIRGALADGAWLLGVCVGYQLLFESSAEFGATDGLGLLAGDVVELPATVPLPHIGWNRIHREQPSHPLLDAIDDGAYMYFVHSFAPVDVPADTVVASCLHGRRFAAIAARGRVLGTQFHPEKSGAPGLRLLANYLRLAAGAELGTAAGD